MEVRLLLIPYDSALRGVRLGAGPEHLVQSGLIGTLEQRGHRVRSTVIEPPANRWRAEIGTAFQLAAALADRVREALAAGAFPLVLAGNCMATLGVVAGLGPRTGVLWFDAHGDFNTPETSVGGFLDGMALATVTGRCWSAIAHEVPGFYPVSESDVWLLGARDLDPLEADALAHSGVRRLGADAIDSRLGDLVRRELAGAARLHIHLDLDVLDPRDGRTNEYAAPDGVRRDALIAACGALGAAGAAALTLSAYDPTFDEDGRVAAVAGEVAVALLDGLTTAAAT